MQIRGDIFRTCEYHRKNTRALNWGVRSFNLYLEGLVIQAAKYCYCLEKFLSQIFKVLLIEKEASFNKKISGLIPILCKYKL